MSVVLSSYSLQSEVKRMYRDLVDSEDQSFAGIELENGYVGIWM